MLHLTYHRTTRTPTINFQNAAPRRAFASVGTQECNVNAVLLERDVKY